MSRSSRRASDVSREMAQSREAPSRATENGSVAGSRRSKQHSKADEDSRPPSRRMTRPASVEYNSHEEDQQPTPKIERPVFPETIDNHLKLMQVVSELFNDENFSDVRLEVGRHQYNAHRIFLARGSEFFRQTLDDPKVRENRIPVIVLEERGDCAKYFEHFLRFLYGDSVTLTTENSLPILRLAEKYKSKALRDLTAQYMIHHCHVPSESNHALSWYRYAKRQNLKQLQEACFNFVLCNFDLIMKSPGWAEIGKNTLKRFIADSDLVVEDEYTLYQGVEEWLRNPDRKYKEEDDAEDVLRFIRFPMIFPDQLQILQDNDFFTEMREEFKPYFYDAFQFHATAQSVWNEESFTVPQIQFCPRNYRSRQFNICQMVSLSRDLLEGKKKAKKKKKKERSSDSEESSEEEESEEEDEESEDEDDEEETKKPEANPNEFDVTDKDINRTALIGNASQFSITVSKPLIRNDTRTPMTFCRKVRYNGGESAVAARLCTAFYRSVEVDGSVQRYLETLAIQDHTFNSKYRMSFMHYPPPDFQLRSYEEYISEKSDQIEMAVFIKPQDDIYQ